MPSSAIFAYVPHPHVTERRGPSRSVARGSAGLAARFNAAVARAVTSGVGTMWCAYVFAVIAMTGLPGLLPEAVARYTLWASTVFLQLVLLSVILVGQSEEAVASEQRADATYHDAEAVLHEALQIQEHLIAQDVVLERLIDRIAPEGRRLAEEPTPSGSEPFQPTLESPETP